MKRASLAISVLFVLLGIVTVGFVQGAIPGTKGCVLRSVDKRDYVARNEAVFRTIPLPAFLRNANTNTYSIAIPAQDPCLPFGDTGPPYGAYVTWHVYLSTPGEVPLGFDERILRGEWVRQPAGTPSEASFRRGAASLNVWTTQEAISLTVDYRGFSGGDR